jgi:hypothetical protein
MYRCGVRSKKLWYCAKRVPRLTEVAEATESTYRATAGRLSMRYWAHDRELGLSAYGDVNGDSLRVSYYHFHVTANI